MCEPEIGLSVDAGGIQTNYLDSGSGDPVLLLHGSGPGVSAWANWNLTIPALAKTHRVLAPDLVGFGATREPPGYEFSMNVWMQHILDFLDALDLPKVAVVGNSFGGALALRLLARAPARVNRGVLMGATGISFPITRPLEEGGQFIPSLDNMRALLNIFVYDKSLITEELVEMRHRASIRPGAPEAFKRMFPSPRQAWVDDMALPPEEIGSIGHEVLLVHGREDQIIPYEVSMRIATLIDRSQYHLFGRCGHWTQIEHAQRFNALVGSFLAETFEV